MKQPNKSAVGRLPSRGWGPWRCEWHSLCSGHGTNQDGNYYGYDTDCQRCVAGCWVNCWMHKIGVYLHDHHYELWFWWANRGR